MKKRQRLLISIFSLLLGLVSLFVLIPYFMKGEAPFPSLWAILEHWKGQEIIPALGWTFIRFTAATILGCFFGIVLGIIESQSSLLSFIFSPWLKVFRVTPSIVWIAVMYSVLPRHLLPFVPIVIGAAFAALYVLLAVEQAISKIDESELIYMHAQGLHSDLKWKFKYSYLPRILAATSYGMKIGGSIALILVVVSEALTSTPVSLGYLLFSYQTTYARELLWVVVFILSLLGLLSFSLFSRLHRLAGGNDE